MLKDSSTSLGRGFHFASYSFMGSKDGQTCLNHYPPVWACEFHKATTLISWELLVLAHKTLRSHLVSWSYDLSWSKSHHVVEADHWCHLPSNRYFDWQTWHRSVDIHKPHQQHLGRYLPLEVGVDCSLAVQFRCCCPIVHVLPSPSISQHLSVPLHNYANHQSK